MYPGSALCASTVFYLEQKGLHFILKEVKADLIRQEGVVLQACAQTIMAA